MIEQAMALFKAEHIDRTAHLPFALCRATKEELLLREDITPRTVILFLMPYYVDTPDNFSAYAAAEDYHYFVKELSARLLPALEALFPTYRFLCFTDHSPIDERHAAVLSGLGVFGKNGLLLTKEYSSFQFIGEIVTDLPPEALGEYRVFPFLSCEDCGACKRACPTGILRGEGEDCLSAITQKKGELSAEEKALMRAHRTAWGCDVCQNVCPYTLRAKASGSIYTDIPFFKENRITHFSGEMLSSLDKQAFARRAFGWRGRRVAERNAKILEDESS